MALGFSFIPYIYGIFSANDSSSFWYPRTYSSSLLTILHPFSSLPCLANIIVSFGIAAGCLSFYLISFHFNPFVFFWRCLSRLHVKIRPVLPVGEGRAVTKQSCMDFPPPSSPFHFWKSLPIICNPAMHTALSPFLHESPGFAFLINFGQFPRSWIRIRISNTDPDPGRPRLFLGPYTLCSMNFLNRRVSLSA